MKTIQEHKAEHTLNKVFRYRDGVMSRRDWIDLKHSQGCTVAIGTKSRVQFNRIKYNRMSSYKEQEEYERKCDEPVPCYKLCFPEGFYNEITKAEYDYFLTK
ncbi:MAG: hypothetical protein AAGU19_08030 [Prolixibacteraceae bacterium]